MNKTHWNTVYVDGTVSDKLIKEWIDDSYELINKVKMQSRKLSVSKVKMGTSIAVA